MNRPLEEFLLITLWREGTAFFIVQRRRRGRTEERIAAAVSGPFGNKIKARYQIEERVRLTLIWLPYQPKSACADGIEAYLATS